MKRSTARMAVPVLSLLVFALAISYSAERRFEKKFSVSPGGTLTVDTDLGTVEVKGTTVKEVYIDVLIKGKERDIKEFEVSAEQTDKGITVKGGTHKKWGWLWNWNDLDAHFVIQVPREYNMHVQTSGGNIGVTLVKGKVLANTSGGNVSAADVEGEVKLETSGGNVLGERLKGDLFAETSGGNIEIAAVTGAVDVSTSGGDVRISKVDGKVRAETSGGDIVVKVVGANKGVFAETSGGDIEIGVPKDVTANIDASTSGGDVTTDLAITMSGKMEESSIHGTVNGGGQTIHAHTSGGDIRIRKGD